MKIKIRFFITCMISTIVTLMVYKEEPVFMIISFCLLFWLVFFVFDYIIFNYTGEGIWIKSNH